MSFRFLTAGESHGKALLGILEGMPSGLSFSQEDLRAELKRRKRGYGRGARQEIETDEVEILSGVRFGKTMGSPISFLMPNRDWQSWQEIMAVEPRPASSQSVSLDSKNVSIHGPVNEPVNESVNESAKTGNSSEKDPRVVHVPRPGHADLIGGIKYRHSDMRNVLERASARETAMRVALGCVARKFLLTLGVTLSSRVVSIGGIEDQEPVEIPYSEMNATSDLSPVRVLGKKAEALMITEIEKAKKEGDTLGGVFEVVAAGVPLGLGSYVQWDRRLEGAVAQAFMSLNAIKGVEVGLGFEAARRFGSGAHDAYDLSGDSKAIKHLRYRQNRSGGIEGGMSSGQPIIIRAAMKPLSTLMKPLSSVDLGSREQALAHVERSDVCAVPSAAVIGESLLALTLTQALLEKFGGDSMEEVLSRVSAWNQVSPIE